MLDFQSKVKRQIEILGLCLSNTSSNNYRICELADLFGVEELTIKRDLQELRANGISIHSTRSKGIEILSSLDEKQLSEIVLHYIGLSYKEYSVDKSTSLLVSKLGARALGFLVMMQRCIDSTVMVDIDYIKEAGEVTKRRICPLLIFQSDGCWRVLAQHEDTVRQYLFDKIASVSATEKSFRRISSERFNELFAYSWKSWIGFEKYDVKLRLNRTWADFLKMRTFIPNQRMTQCGDGSIVFEASVNSLREIASWIVSKGEGVEVLEPQELKDIVLDIAEGVIRNYRTESIPADMES